MNKIFSILILLFIISCSNDDQSSNSNFNEQIQIDLITGINLRDENGVIYSEYGNPNVLDDEIIISSNPVEDSFSIKSTTDIITIWIIKGKNTILFQDADYSNILENDLYSDDDIDALAEIKLDNFKTEVNVDENAEENVEENGFPIPSLEDETVNSVLINASELSAGYYRIFIKTAKGTSWDNLYVSNDTLDLAQFDFFENEF